MPFGEEILRVSNKSPVPEQEEELIDASIVFDGLSNSIIPIREFVSMLDKAKSGNGPQTTFDPSQCNAVLAAMQNNIGIVQGPPGTGKTFGG